MTMYKMILTYNGVGAQQYGYHRPNRKVSHMTIELFSL